ncbi:MAG: FliM/FliN family flagellar motor switch protein [Pseudomonadota bacterium]
MKAATATDDDVYLDKPSSPEDLRRAAAANPNILTLPVLLTVSVGSARLTIEELLSLNADTILTLNAAIDDPVDLLIGDRVVAQGALVETEGETPGLGVRIVSVIGDRKTQP